MTAVAAPADVALPSVTLPGADRAAPRQVFMTSADDTGYLSTQEPTTLTSTSAWVGRDGSVTEGLANPIAVNGGYGLEAVNGGYGLERDDTASAYRIRQYATGKVVQIDMPAGDKSTGVFAANRLLTLRQTDGKWTLHLLEVPAGGGQPVDRLVSGVPDDFGQAVYDPSSDDRGAAFWFYPKGSYVGQGALLDFATAALTPVPIAGFSFVERPHLTGDKVVFAAEDASSAWHPYVVDRDRPTEPGVLGSTPTGIQLVEKTRALGDWLLHPDGDKGTIKAEPIAGGAARTVLPASAGTLVDGADGSLYVEGGTDAQHWAIQHITLAADGTPTVTADMPVPAASVYDVGGLAVDQGRVLIASERPDATGPQDGTYLAGSALSLSADGTLAAAPPQDLGDLGYEVPFSDPFEGYHQVCYGPCLPLTGTGESSVAHAVYGVPAVIAASGTYLVVRRDVNQLVVRDGSTELTTGTWATAALWGSTLWTPGSTTGTVTAVSLWTLAPISTVSVGATCALKDLQVVGRWIYWSCGPDGDAGVYDQVTKKLIDVPSGYAELADGYLVNQDDAAGKLRITYFPGAVPADQVGTTDLGPLPSPLFAPADERGRFWAVDRFGGPAAYLTDTGDVTVKWPQVTTSKLTLLTTRAPTIADLPGDGFTGGWDLSKPASGWKVALSSSTNAVVRTFTGGHANGKISVTWDGTATNGSPAAPGVYRWTLTATAADQPAESVTATGSVRSMQRHDYGKDGIGDLVTMDVPRRLAIQPGNGKGGIDTAAKALSGGWSPWAYPVPFGDLTGDGCNDLLIRGTAGSLTRYTGSCGKAITPNSPHTELFINGFGNYTVLTSPGDVTGDGYADLIARDKAGVLWLYAGDGKGSFKPRVKGVSGQGKYTRMVGAGDLNGDGLGDLVAVDGAGVLWHLLGNGKGGFSPRVKIATGFGAYNVFAVAGDLTGDGRPDLVARDKAGVLWRWTGKSNGTFTGRTRVSAGWGGYLYLV